MIKEMVHTILLQENADQQAELIIRLIITLISKEYVLNVGKVLKKI